MARAPPFPGTCAVEPSLTAVDQNIRAPQGETDMSIHDFHSRLVLGGERNALFAALRRLSTVDNPNKLFAAEPNQGWPIWDGAGTPPASRLADATA